MPINWQLKNLLYYLKSCSETRKLKSSFKRVQHTSVESGAVFTKNVLVTMLLCFKPSLQQ